MEIGITLLFIEKKLKKIRGILKSTVLELENMEDLELKVDKFANKVCSRLNYKYHGINDLFTVCGNVSEGEILGRSSFYELDKRSKAKTLVKKKNFSFDKKTILKNFNCSLIYFCSNAEKEFFTISILSILSSSTQNVLDDTTELGFNQNFINKIKNDSIEEIESIEFIGVEDICDIDLQFNVFQSFYADFENMELLNEEILSSDEVEDVLKDIFT